MTVSLVYMNEINVLSIAMNPPKDIGNRVETNLNHMLSLLDKAKAYDPDFVNFAEYNLQYGYDSDGQSLDEVAQPIPGPATAAIGELAEELDSYVLCPMKERSGDTYYNSVALIDRDGDVVGTYRKLAPVIQEMEEGIEPGAKVKVWETEFGRVGALICWDSRYDEIGLRLAQEGAELVFYPTLDNNCARQRFLTWTKHYGYHIVLCDHNEAKIFTPKGTVVAETSPHWGNPVIDLGGGGEARMAFAKINTDCRTYGRIQNGKAADEIRREYAGSIVFHELDETGNIAIESIDDDLSLTDIERKYNIETMFEYEDRTRKHIQSTVDSSPFI